MFSALFVSFALIATSAFAAPVKLARDGHVSPNHVPSKLTKHVRFNGWQGFQSLHNFDDFYGWDNFDGHRNQHIIVREKQLVCHKVEVEHVQQQLVIIQEYVKRVIVEQVCEVEVQTILLSQWSKRFDDWHKDIRRKSKREVSFDHEIAGHFPKLVDEHGAIRKHNWGFKGFDVGKKSVVVIGDNWDHKVSPHRVDKAFWDSWGFRDYYGFEFPQHGFEFDKGHEFQFEKYPVKFVHPDYDFRRPDFGFFDGGRLDSGFFEGGRLDAAFPIREGHSPAFSYFPGTGEIIGDEGADPIAIPPPEDVVDDTDPIDDAIPTSTTSGSVAPTGTETATSSTAAATESAAAGAAVVPPIAG